jgi:hypothetical protein
MSNFIIVLLLTLPGGPGDPLPGPQTSPNAATLSPRDIADQAIKARGGAEKLGRFKATMATIDGKLYHSSGIAVTTGQSADEGADRQWYDYKVELPDRRKIRLAGAVDGNREWTTVDGVVEHQTREELDEVREGMYGEYVATLRPLLDRSVPLARVGQLEVDGKPAVGIIVTVKGHRPVRLYFDNASWLLVKSECRQKNLRADRFYVREVFFSRYRPIRGVQCAHHTETNRDGKLFSEYELSNMKLLEKLDDDLFVEPASKTP